MDNREWFGFDLDGTLARKESGMDTDRIGAVISGDAAVRLKKLYDEGRDVRIVTARVSSVHSRRHRNYQDNMIKHWIFKNFGIWDVPVQAEKEPGMVALYDDRACMVEYNTGRIITPTPQGMAAPTPAGEVIPLPYRG